MAMTLEQILAGQPITRTIGQDGNWGPDAVMGEVTTVQNPYGDPRTNPQAMLFALSQGGVTFDPTGTASVSNGPSVGEAIYKYLKANGADERFAASVRDLAAAQYGHKDEGGWVDFGDFRDWMKEDIIPFAAMAAATYGGVSGLGSLAGAGEAVGSASAGGTTGGGALSAAQGAGTAGTLGAEGGLYGAGSLMPAAVPQADPTFGGALTQTAPGVYATPGAGGYLGTASGVGASGVSGAEGAFPSTGIGAGTAAGGATASKSIFDRAVDAAPGAIAGALTNPSILGALGGAALGGLSGGSKPAGNITVTEDIPDWLKPYVKPQLDKYSSLVQNYQTDPYGVMPSAMQEFQKTIQGDYLNPETNKWLQQYFNLGAERVKGSLSPSFGHMQAFGQHSGYNEALSRGLGDLAVGLYGGNYQKERDRQSQAMSQAGNFLTSGSQAAFSPYQSYINTVGGLGKQKTEPYFNNPFGNVLGGAMAGYGLGSIFK